MTNQVAALLVHQNSETMLALKSALERQGIRVAQASSRASAKRLLGGLEPAPLVFTDSHLADGNWLDILAAAGSAKRPVNVIVVARVVDTRFYVQAIETGAFDFITPPFNPTDLAYVLRSALDNVSARRAVFGPIASVSTKPATVKTPEIGATVASS
jgi:DNA-binding NtrC family response regulator